jgi:hypothetical protein
VSKTARENGYRTALFSENPFFSAQNGFGHEMDYVDDGIDFKLYRSGFSVHNHVSEISPEAALTAGREILARPNWVRNALNVMYGLSTYHRDSTSYPHNGDRVLDHLVSYVNTMDDRPLFCIANFLDPHNPHYVTPPGYEDSVEVSMTEIQRTVLRDVIDNKQYMLTTDEPPAEAKPTFPTWDDVYDYRYQVYKAQVRYFDSLVDRWMRELPKSVLRNSLVLVVGDHGQMFGEVPRHAGHQVSFHPTGVRVPFFVHPPADWDVTTSLQEPISLANVGTALCEVMKGTVSSFPEFKDVLSAARRDGDVATVWCDGPNWPIETLRNDDRWDPSKVESLAVRKLGLVSGDTMDVYQCPWGGCEIKVQSYELTVDSRTEISTEGACKLKQKEREWLRDGGQYVSGRRESEISDRLKSLGYL